MDDVEVKLSAQTGELNSSIKTTEQSVAASMQSIAASLAKFGQQNKEVVNTAIKNNADLSRSFLELKGSVTGGFNAITGVVARFRGVLGSLTAALAGGMIGKESVTEMLRLEDEVRGLTITFGTTTDKATQMAIALKLAGSSAEAFEGMAFKVGRMLKNQSEEFDRLKVSIRNASGEFLPMDVILQNIFKRMQDFKAGTDQNEFALSTVGRSAKDFASDMLRLNAVTDRAAQLQRELGIEMGPERIAAIEAYRIETHAFGLILGNVGDKIGEAVLPQLMNLARYFNDVGPSVAEFFVKAIKLVIATIDALATGAKRVWLQVSNAWNSVVTATTAMAQALKALVTDGWTAAVNIVANANDRILRNTMETNAAVLGLEADLVKRLAALDAPASKPAGPGPMGSGRENFTVKPKGGGGSDDRLAAWKDDLLKLQEAEGYFHEFSKTQEAEFWQAKLALVTGKGKEDVKLRRELDHLIFADKKAAANEELQLDLAKWQRMIDEAKENKDQQIAVAVARTATIKALFGEESRQYERVLDEEIKLRERWVAKEQEILKLRTKMAEAQATHDVEMQRLSLDQQVALGNLSAEQKFAVEQQLEDRLYSLKRKALTDELATLQEGTKAYVEVAAQIETLEQTHQIALTKIANAAVLERERYAIEANKMIEGSFATLFADMAQHTKSLRQMFADLFKTIGDGLIKLGANQMAEKLFGAGSQGGGAISSLTSRLFGGAGGAVGGAAGKSADTAAETAHTAATTADTAATTALTAGITAQTAGVTAQQAIMTTLNAITTSLQAAFTTLTSATEVLAAAMQKAAMSGGGGGGLGSLFGGGGFGDIIPSFAVGTGYVPRDMVANIHKGEAIIPASLNKPGAGSAGSSFTQNVHVHVTGSVDTRTLDQINAAAYRGAQRANARVL